MPRTGGQGKGKPKLVDRSFGVGLIKSQVQRAANSNSNKNTRILSILDNSSLDDYILSAEMDERKTEVIKTNYNDVHLVEQFSGVTVKPVQSAFNGQYAFNQLNIPRRPAWDKTMSAEELHRQETESFLQWRRNLGKAELLNQDKKLTPFEKNLDVWRQLWRVIEKCDLLIQIVDARNPLFYLCEDLRAYILEHGPHKQSFVLVNKADFLTEHQRNIWRQKFNELGIPFIYYSARLEEEVINQSGNEHLNQHDVDQRCINIDETVESIADSLRGHKSEDRNHHVKSSMNHIINRAELVILIEKVSNSLALIPQSKNDGKICFGLIGYPNVGKSSVINTLLNVSKSSHGPRVSVSSTPGRTKHLQTFVLSNTLILCDCPGLVFPSFMVNVGEMLCSGVLPINHMRDYIEPAAAIAVRIPKHILEAVYGMKIKRDLDVFDNPDRPPTAHEILAAYCAVNGYITNGTGRWDEFRATKELLKDFNDGCLLYITPPEMQDLDIQLWVHETEKTLMQNKKVMDRLQRQQTKEIDRLNIELSQVDEEQEVDDNRQEHEKKREHKRLQHWGKKNRKMRDKTPYDEESGHGSESYVPLFKNRT